LRDGQPVGEYRFDETAIEREDHRPHSGGAQGRERLVELFSSPC
jgi:hypothetical protein